MSTAIYQDTEADEATEQATARADHAPTALMVMAVVLTVLGLDLVPGIQGFNGVGRVVISVVLWPGKYWFLFCFGLAAGLASLLMARKSEQSIGALALSGLGIVGLTFGLFLSGELALHRACSDDFNPPACAGEPFDGVDEFDSALSR